MANECAIFPNQMSGMQFFWPSNDMYMGCSPNTLTQLQEKVLRSLSKRQEEENLQVVPENNNVFDDYSSNPCQLTHETRDCSGSRLLPFYQDENKLSAHFPWSPGLHKSPITTTCTSLEPLSTPTFPFSPLLKSPGFCSAPRSPLAMMVLSPFGRKPSEDLSVYLPENFTPATTLERLERSITSTVFQFPSVEQDQDEAKETKRNCNEKEISDEKEIDVEDTNVYGEEENGFYLNTREVFLDFNDAENFGGTEIVKDDFQKTPNLNQTKDGKKKVRSNKGNVDCFLGIGFRNGLERKRRSEMNSKYEKLRRFIPELENRQKASKILVLRTAAQYIKELQRQDELLSKQKDMEKRRNEELLKKLVKINS